MIVGGIVVVAIVGWAIWSFSGGVGPSPNATTTSTTVNNDTNTTGTNTVVTSQAGLPIVVTNSSFSPTDTTAVVNGTVNPRGAFTSYWYEYGNTNNLGSKTLNQTLGSGFVSIQAPAYITGLVKNTTYYFRLVAENRYGRVVGGQYTLETTEGVSTPVGSAPRTKTLPASAISRTTAIINGEVTPNNASTQYWFEYGKTVELGDTSAFSSIGDGNTKSSASVSLSSLEPLTTYYFRINAQNQFGTINGSILNFKTLGPVSAKVPSVTTGNASAVTSSGATLHGTVNPNLADTKYWFEYSTNSLLGQVLLQSSDPVNVGAGGAVVPIDKFVTGLNSGTNYYFRLVAENSMGTVRGERQAFKTKN